MTNPRNFLFTTDYQQDKVVYLTSGTYTIPSPTAGAFLTIPHGLPFIPLVGGGWSTGSGFTITFDYGTGPTPSSNPSASPFNFHLDIAADDTNIYLVPTNVSGSSQVVYYRIYGLEPSDSTADLDGTASSADNFALNTDFNYTKLYAAGALTGLSSSASESVSHDLGIVPQVNVWATNTALTINGVFFQDVRYPISLTIFIVGQLNDVSAIVDDSTVDFATGSSSNTERIDYRIYYDETGA